MSKIPSQAGGQTEPVQFDCQKCGKKLQVVAALIGQTVQCPGCSGVQPVPDPRASPPSASHQPPDSPVPKHHEQTDSRSGPFPPDASSSGPPQLAAARGSLSPNPPSSTPPPVVPSTSAPATQTIVSSSIAEAEGSPRASADATTRVFPPPPQTPSDPAMPAAVSSAAPQEPARETPTKQLFDRILREIAKIYVGQDELVLGTLVALFSSGHVLIESVPGLGKTLFVRTLGRVLGCEFGRIQFTADLMPSDITGAPIFDMKQQDFRFRPGPVFTQLLLADEINRSPAKTHAALLEIMQEYRVTIDGNSHEIERPFLVLATQNPIESEGTYNLPEAQLDRFMFKLMADYPEEREESRILHLHSQQIDLNDRLQSDLETVTSPEEILQITRENSDVTMDERLIDYINKIVRLTRQWPQFHLGASPRAGIALMQARANARRIPRPGLCRSR